MGDMTDKKPTWQRLLEATLGAMRHVMEKPKVRGFIPVGFCVVLYNPDAEHAKRWHCEPHVIVDEKNPDLYDAKIRARIDLVNKYVAEGIKQILEGRHDDLMADKSSIVDGAYQIPGMKGKV